MTNDKSNKNNPPVPTPSPDRSQPGGDQKEDFNHREVDRPWNVEPVKQETTPAPRPKR